VCTGTLVNYERTVRERVARPGRRMRRMCTGTLVHYEPTDWERVALTQSCKLENILL